MPGLTPSHNLGKPGRAGLVPSRGCGGSCEADFSYLKAGVSECEYNFTDNSTPSPGATIVAWEWDFDGEATSTEQNPTHSFSGAGSLPVTLTITDSTGCQSTVIKTVVCLFSCECPVDGLPSLPFTVSGVTEGRQDGTGGSCGTCASPGAINGAIFIMDTPDGNCRIRGNFIPFPDIECIRQASFGCGEMNELVSCDITIGSCDAANQTWWALADFRVHISPFYVTGAQWGKTITSLVLPLQFDTSHLIFPSDLMLDFTAASCTIG